MIDHSSLHAFLLQAATGTVESNYDFAVGKECNDLPAL
jgi:hypothetical protein